MGYTVVIDPMLTGTWNDQEQDFYRLIGAIQKKSLVHDPDQTALFLDPDTGINDRGGKQHVSFDRLVHEASSYALVFSFDQSFSRQENPVAVMQDKLEAIEARGCHGMYYDSHAHFLFASSQKQRLHELRAHIVALGLPNTRLIERGA